MPRVRSDEIATDAEENHEPKEKTPSPIGAGLPLLQRLRLLKEKQVSDSFLFFFSVNLFLHPLSCLYILFQIKIKYSIVITSVG